MTQKLDKLRTAVDELKHELQSAPAVDEDTRTALEEVIGQIQGALHQPGKSPLEPESLAERLQVAEERFSVSHPTLSAVLLRMIDVLGQMGI